MGKGNKGDEAIDWEIDNLKQTASDQMEPRAEDGEKNKICTYQ